MCAETIWRSQQLIFNQLKSAFSDGVDDVTHPIGKHQICLRLQTVCREDTAIKSGRDNAPKTFALEQFFPFSLIFIFPIRHIPSAQKWGPANVSSMSSLHYSCNTGVESSSEIGLCQWWSLSLNFRDWSQDQDLTFWDLDQDWDQAFRDQDHLFSRPRPCWGIKTVTETSYLTKTQ